MSKKFMRKLDRMGRRRFLNTLGGPGLSATTHIEDHHGLTV
jgi:hypothetical protein